MIPPDQTETSVHPVGTNETFPGTSAVEASPVPPVPPSPPPRRALWIGVAAVVTVALVAAAVIVLSAGEDPSTPGPATITPGLPSPTANPRMSPPLGVHAEATEIPLAVTVAWIAPPGTVTGYRVYRDGDQVGTVPAPETSFTDNDVRPRHTYSYEVLATGQGLLQSERVGVSVTVPAPPLSAARVEGIFNVKVHPTSQSGFTQSFRDYTTGWSFSPKCDTGACTVVWRWTAFKDIKDTLARTGAKYSGSDSGRVNVKCGGTTVTSTVTIHFRVVKARAAVGTWTATRLVGTLKQTSDAQLGCVSSSLTADITATLLS